MMKNLRYNNNLPSFKEGLGKVFLTLCLLMASMGAWAQTYYVFQNGTYGYLYNDNGTLKSSTTFQGASSVWYSPNDLGTTSQTIRSYSDNSRYLNVGANNGGTVSLGTNTTARWQLRTYLATRNSNTNYYLKRTGNNVFSTATGTNNSYLYTPVAVTISSTDPSLSEFTISGGTDEMTATGNSPAFSHSNATYTAQRTNYRFNNADHYVNGASATVSYTWSLSGIEDTYAEVTSEGVVRYKSLIPEPSREVTLTCTASAGGVTQTATKTITFKNPNGIFSPSISYDNAAGGKVAVTLSYPESDPDVKLFYTINGSNPSASSTEYTGPFEVASNTTIKAIAVKGSTTSGVVSEVVTTISSGVSGGKVVLDDREDHNWTYYAGVDSKADGGNYNTNYKGKLYSPNPRNVKITYYGKGRVATTDDVNGDYIDISNNSSYTVQVGINAPENTFVYYKTLERDNNSRYPYTTIPNPFSVRPVYSTGTTSTTKWRGFYRWRIKTLTDGSIYTASTGGTALAVGAYLEPDVEYYFQPSDYNNDNYTINGTSMTVELEAVWVRAYVNTTNSNTNFVSKANGGWERNFVVYTSGTGNTATGFANYPVTYTALYPNGTTNGTTAANAVPNVSVATNMSLSGDVKIENIRMDGGATLNTDAHNLWVARGVTGTGTGGSCATLVKGIGGNKTGAIAYKITLESGTYGGFRMLDDAGRTLSSTVSAKAVFGCDYDRASSENDLLHIAPSGEVWGGNGSNQFSSTNNRNNLTYDWLIKSGKVQENVSISDAAAARSIYMGNSISGSNGVRYAGKRRLIMEGGQVASIAGGVNCYDTYATTYGVNDGSWALMVRIKGGQVRGSIYGAAAYSGAAGDRYMILTGGEINGWVAGGANGTQATGGVLNGASYVYAGGNTTIDSNKSTTLINRAVGGNLFGAGCGYHGNSSSGQVDNGTNVVVADDASIERGVYGGGSFGYCATNRTSNVYITGGHVYGNVGGVTATTGNTSTAQYSANITGGVFGGACQNAGGTVNVYMTGGIVEGGLYGGSNATGTISNNITMRIDGGQVGTDSKTANIHGGGYGQNTQVTQNVVITLGKKGAARDADGVIVWGDVYGGSALGSVNGTEASDTYHTNVTMNTGYIHGSLYGGALGQKNGVNGATSDIAANVYGPVAVTVNGGSVFDGAVYGCNNINGTPQRDVTVTINGTNMPTSGYALNAVYGGGNMADYIPVNGVTGFPKVYVNGCENSIKDLYGGGNAASVPNTYIEVQGGLIDRLFAGGNGESGTAAHVGNQSGANNTPGTQYGTGNTYAKIMGGEIHQIFGGSNSLGKIRGTITLDVDKEDYCDVFRLGEIYGGGNEAPSQSGQINIGCTGTYTAANGDTPENGYIRTVYGGANAADVTGNINLSITGGHIDNVFGGNNERGTISGTINVTVNDAGTCTMLVGNVYGGGNKAAYGTSTTAKYPEVNILSGHITGSVYGGGLGTTAIVTGAPQVTIGDAANLSKDDVKVQIDGDVYGGGDAAAVTGIPVVKVINKCNTEVANVYGGGNAADVDGTNVTIDGGIISGMVFGGGHGDKDANPVKKADVKGNVIVTVTGGTIEKVFGGSNSKGDITGTINLNIDKGANSCDMHIKEVYGGGNQASGNAGNITIGCTGGQDEGINDVYGGANAADVNNDIVLTIKGGTIDRVFGGNNTSGEIKKSITVNINEDGAKCGLNLNYVYGAGNQASYTPSTPGAYPAVNILKGTVKQDVFGGGLGATAVVTSNPTVTVNGGTVSGNVFGGGSEANTVGTTSVTVQAGTVSTDVYGGGALADVQGNTTVAITGGTVTGNAYGGGLGQLASAAVGTEGEPGYIPAKEAVAAAVTGNTNVTVSGGTTNNVFGCNNFNGGPQGTVNVTISGGTVTNHVYGGGNLAAAEADPIVTINGGTMQNVYGGGLGAPAVITGNTSININKTAPTMSVGNVFGGGSAANVAGNTSITMTEGTVSNIYGGGEAANVVVGADDTGKTVVLMNGGTVSHSIYGGGLGNMTEVATSTTVTANGGTVSEDVYGGSGFGKVQATTVTINNGATVTRDVFGGGFGQNADAGAGKEAYEADVTGNASVTIKKGAVINGNVYGGNNTNGSPKGTITVLVDGPVDATEKAATPLNLNDVFGGGKNAATTSTGAPQVTIQGCETVIARVFGGGDAASAPDTDVTIWGGHITSAFAGGNGENVPAHVGYEADGTTEYTTGNGDVKITIKGGTITNVFGGSNNAGNIRGDVNVVVDKDPAACDLDVTNLFGGGNLAPGKGGTLTIACTGDGKIDNVYGGANQADVEGDVTLVINGGNIGNAFGGNNQSGTINGAIKVVINWEGDCGVNNLDNVYGGGNLAPYTTPDGMVGPTVQLINATINNNVYGGGLGAPAKVTGNPIVTLEGATVTGNIFGGGDAAPVEGNPTVTAMYGSAAKIFAGGKGATAVVTGNPTAVLNKADDKTLTITEIYGGGDAAEVTGNTTVTLTKGAVTNAFGGGNAAAINGNTLVTIANATASNVYGGGNLAGVTQTATINMTGGNVTTGLFGGCNSEGTVTGDIAVNVTGGQVGTDAEHKANVHGGGYGSATQTAGNVAVAVNGAGVVVFGDIYGGSALGNVNDNTSDNTTVTITAGTVNGDVYGGGLGDASNAALVNGNVAVNINGGTVTGNVFGCNNVNGTPKGSVAVTVAADANATLTEVYGGGNMATYSPTTAQAPVVTILGCGNTIGYVYGGGNAADVPATNVTVWGGTIGNVFGGGHGNKDAVPATAANVTGNVTVNIKGGTITNVFAGSNSKGNIGGTVALTIDKDGDCPMHITDVYGGGNQAAGNAGQVTIGCTGGADEGIQNVYGGANAADINSNIALVITGGTINNVFGGNNSSGNISGTIDVTVDWNGSCTTNHINNVYGAGNQAAYTGSPTVKIYNGTVSQNVFGGGLGATAVVTGNPVVTIGDADPAASAKVATVGGDVYGGGDAAAVVGTTHVNVIAKENTTINNVYGGGNAADVNGTDVNIDGGNITGMVFGGGHGNAGASIAANVNGNVSVDVTGGTINKVFGGSNDMGNISGTVAVNINKGDDSDEMHITEVYGGGNVAAGNAGTVTIGCTGGATEGIGTVYGGANNADVGNAIVLNISGGSIDNVFGGNNNGGAVAGSITVNVNWTGTCGVNKLGNVYGAGNIASYTGNPTVNITNCTTTGSVFGGGKGKPAVVVGNPTVNIGSWTAGAVSIGGNVFGGGDLAAVEGAPTVTIRDCNTYIGGDLYGGGNAAPVYETNTTVWGGTIAGNLFGGGNGVNLDSVTGNPKGAQVGYDHTDLANGGSGNANTYLYGGTIGVWNGNECTSGGGVFGGSNSNGNIRGNVNLNVDERACSEPSATQCPLKIKEIYGAGNEAAYVGSGIDFNLGCVSFLGEIYGGAKAADLNADAILTITSGTFGKVFGGNNVSGKLNGKIVVTIDETGCNPVIIDELYGGGNEAAYSVYGYEDNGTPKTSGASPKADPVVNIISCTRIGTVFGGGYGETAVMVGSPTVNINQILGDHAAAIGGKLGAIGTVFGGGNAAKVVGNTNVNVGTMAQNKHLGTDDATKVAAGANITGNVYGGGNQADVTGKTNVTIGQ